MYCISSLNRGLGEVHSMVVLSEGQSHPRGFPALCRAAQYPAVPRGTTDIQEILVGHMYL